MNSTVYRIYPTVQNFRAHAAELGNPVPQKPILFLKPTSAYITQGQNIRVSLVWNLIQVDKFVHTKYSPKSTACLITYNSKNFSMASRLGLFFAMEVASLQLLTPTLIQVVISIIS